MARFMVELSVRRVWRIEVEAETEVGAMRKAWAFHDEKDGTPECGELMDELVTDRIVGGDEGHGDEEGWAI